MSGKGSAPDRPLWARYTATQGRVHLTGLQALVRLALDQLRRDRRAGRRVGALFSGYPGSPLAGLDQTLAGLAPLLEREDVRLVPALNEELAAAAICGTQALELFPHSDYDGVLGLWFGKAPGLDRAMDALRHANFMGSARFGGALAIVGDDPFCKSSSLPSHSEHAFAHALVPLLAPADAADVLFLGRHAIELSRYTGLWSGLRMSADVADAGGVFDLEVEPAEPERPKFEILGVPFEPRFDAGLLPPRVNEIEREIIFARLEAARRYAAANGLNPIAASHARDRTGLVAAGPLYRELRGALDLLDIDDDELARLGLRLLKLDLVWPLDPQRLREFAEGLDEIIVVDGRRGFVEEQIRSVLFNGVDRPMVIGQYTETGEPWLARRSEVNAGSLAVDLAHHLAARLDEPALEQRSAAARAALERASGAAAPSRAPHFCSGCPHSTSTRLPEGSVAGGGIGCHTMTLLMDRGVHWVGAMGSEGAHWIGLAPYADAEHIFQNLGDGTYFHSGRLAVRAAVEAGVRITYKILYNDVVAMTGGQRATGAKPIADLVEDLLRDGVRKVVAMSDDSALRALAARSAQVELVPRERWNDAMIAIRDEPGVTALVYDEICANHKQRLERRGVLPRPGEQVLIHEDVCEGCGDCGVRSTCASLRPVETTLGRKTRIHESSCSDDRSCLAGDCPAFVSVALPQQAAPPEPFDAALPDPPALDWDGGRYDVLMVGIGSTGVVTVDALLVRAAELDGAYALHLDQTGLAQRGGKVVSHFAISSAPLRGSPRVGPGRADLLLAFDPLGASDSQSLAGLDPERSHALMHELYVPTGSQVSDPGFRVPPVERFADELRACTRTLHTLRAEELATAALGQPMAANVLLLGAALQLGCLPVSVESLEQAIRDNGVAVDKNLRALRLGRAAIADPKLVPRLLADATPPAIGDADAERRARECLGRDWQQMDEALDGFAISQTLHDLRRELAGFAADLVDYQSARYARGYLGVLTPLALAEAKLRPADPSLVRTAARELYRLMAYKDEYEVARLLLRGPFRRWLERRRGAGLRLRYHLHPPLLRALGLRRKLAFGSWVEGPLRALAALRRLRGTALDPFGWLASRRLERELRDWYADLLRGLADRLDAGSLERVTEAIGMVEQIRGYEGLKAERAARVRPRVEALLAD